MNKINLALAALLLPAALTAQAADYSLGRVYVNPNAQGVDPILCNDAEHVDGSWRLLECRPYPKELVTVPENLYVIHAGRDFTVEPNTDRTVLNGFNSNDGGKTWQGVSCDLKHNKVSVPRKIEKGSQFSIVTVAPFEKALSLEAPWEGAVTGIFGIKSASTGAIYQLVCGFHPKHLPGIDEFFVELNAQDPYERPFTGTIRF